MEVVMLQDLVLVLKVCIFACVLVIQGSAVSVEKGKPGHVFSANVFISKAPTPVPQPIGKGLQPPFTMPPLKSAPVPQMTKGHPSSTWPSPSASPSIPFITPPGSIPDLAPSVPPIPSSGNPQHSEYPPFTVRAPAPVISPSGSPAPDEQTHPPLPELMPPFSHKSKTSNNNAPTSVISPVSNVPAPGGRQQSPSSSHSHFPKESPSLPPDVSIRPALPGNSPPVKPISIEPPSNPPGSSASPPPTPSGDNTYSLIPAPSPIYPSGKATHPSAYPNISPSGSPRKSPKMSLLPPVRALPPPPPHKDCELLTCTEPLAYGPPESPCVCVLPIQVGLRLSVASYTFFPLVAELAAEIAAGIFTKQSQVRIMGANAAGDDTEKTIVLIDLLPLGERFDDTTAYLIFHRFWSELVSIKTSIFGDYDVLYVRYPGLPPSPPLPPSDVGVVASKPYPGHDNNTRTMQPLGVDISRKQHNHGLSRSILATIILFCFVAVILLWAVAWIFLFRYRECAFQPDPTPPATIHSLAKSSGRAVTMVGSGISSPSFSLGSSIAAYTGSAKTFSSSDIERATDFFNETRILGEGGFGRVYGGVLEDGTKVAIKILKRYDQQSGREFLAEVEMLSRLHHRNLVKLIGICVEDCTRCLVYELVPNGSVESHLHGIDKERSPLDWGARLKIALGAARALAYLHEDSSPRVIHRDFKASNILLEDDFIPKVSDFGLARSALDEENKHISTRVMGTFGYVAPEYAMTGHLLVKSDVYSYGVVLLELLTGRKPIDMSQPPGQENLVSWARPLLTSREGLESIIDQSLAPDDPFDSIAKVAAIASMCVQPEVSHRPFMGEVVQALKLICSECDEMKELPSESCSQEDMTVVTEARNSTNSDPMPAPLLTPSTVSDYDYRLDLERDLSMSELLSSSTKFQRQDCDSFRRYSSSGPLRTSKARQLWKTVRPLPRASMSDHGVLFKPWPGSH